MEVNNLLVAALWIIVGCWIAYKRNWYSNFNGYDSPPAGLAIFVCIFFAPISLLIAFFREMVFDSWNNN
jgi:TRAP-type C4-dicarboxylate transport system permease small subunit